MNEWARGKEIQKWDYKQEQKCALTVNSMKRTCHLLAPPKWYSRFVRYITHTAFRLSTIRFGFHTHFTIPSMRNFSHSLSLSVLVGISLCLCVSPIPSSYNIERNTFQASFFRWYYHLWAVLNEHTFRSSCRASNKHVCIKHAVSSRIGSKYMFLFLYIWGSTFSILFLCASTFTVILRYTFVNLLLLIFYSHIRFAQFCVFFILFHFILFRAEHATIMILGVFFCLLKYCD